MWPIYVKAKTGQEKAYMVLFMCADTGFVHLELCTTLSTETFLLAFKRFISRRGIFRKSTVVMRKRLSNQVIYLKKFETE